MLTTTIAITILALAGIAVIVLFATNANRRRRRLEDVPPGMRPAYSDEELEGTVLERYMQWGLVLTIGMALFFPIYWLNESRRLNSEAQNFFVESVVRGEDLYQANCAECHAPNLAGGAAASPYSDSSWPAPALNNIATRYAENRNVVDIHDFVVQTLQRGRPGTPMPTWGAAYGGPMTDQQIEDITAYILANQVEEVSEATAAADLSGEELYVGNCAKCHGENLEGIVGPSLIGVTERHTSDDILGILTTGITMPTGAVMPGFSEEHYQYEDARYTQDALERIVAYLQERQPDELPEDASRYQTPGEGQQAALDAPAGSAENDGDSGA